ncbi:unnamed protein product, partial [Meganyctiphanes norvegica]
MCYRQRQLRHTCYSFNLQVRNSSLKNVQLPQVQQFLKLSLQMQHGHKSKIQQAVNRGSQPYRIYFPFDEPSFCSETPDLQIIAYVASTIVAVGKRNITRNTWGSAYTHGLRLRVVFMVGKPKNDNEENILQTESDHYHDIIQGDFTDQYHLVAYKILSSMYWVNTRCPSVPWVIRADDDILVDIFLLRKILPRVSTEGFNCYIMSHSDTNIYIYWAIDSIQYSLIYRLDFCTKKYASFVYFFKHHKMVKTVTKIVCPGPPYVWFIYPCILKSTHTKHFCPGQLLHCGRVEAEYANIIISSNDVNYRVFIYY